VGVSGSLKIDKKWKKFSSRSLQVVVGPLSICVLHLSLSLSLGGGKKCFRCQNKKRREEEEKSQLI
jgi:hypothetical protein